MASAGKYYYVELNTHIFINEGNTKIKGFITAWAFDHTDGSDCEFILETLDIILNENRNNDFYSEGSADEHSYFHLQIEEIERYYEDDRAENRKELTRRTTLLKEGYITLEGMTILLKEMKSAGV